MTVTDPLLEAARSARLQAYAPYSRLRVGAAVRSSSGRIYLGCNVENAAFPIGGCAEHHAIVAAVLGEGPQLRLTAVAVAALNDAGREVPIPPCGACRQFIYEFGPEATVSFPGRDGGLVNLPISDLLPHTFTFEPGAQAGSRHDRRG